MRQRGGDGSLVDVEGGVSFLAGFLTLGSMGENGSGKLRKRRFGGNTGVGGCEKGMWGIICLICGRGAMYNCFL